MPRFSPLMFAAAAAALLPAVATAQDDRRDRGDRPDFSQQRGDRGGRGDGQRDRGYDGGDRPQQQPQQAQQQPQAQQVQPQAQSPQSFDRRQFGGRDGQPQFQQQPDGNRDRGERPGGAFRPAPGNGDDPRRGFAQGERRPDGTGRYPGSRDDRGGAAFRPAPGSGYAGNDGRRDPRRDGGYARNDGRDRRDDRWQGGGQQGGFRADWRQDRRYDWRGYRSQNRQQFRAPRYVPPRGYGFGYRSFSIGFRLDPWLYQSNYWISDPYAYRLPPVDGPYRWVRYYDDVLLIDLRSGEVVDAIQGFFF